MSSKFFFHKLFIDLFPPESRGEILLRSFYHSIMATKIASAWQIRNSNRSYRKWKQKKGGTIVSNIQSTHTDIKVSFILHIPDTQFESGLDTIRSVQGILQSDWELLVFSANPVMLRLGNMPGGEKIAIIDSAGGLKLPDLLKLVSGKYFIFCHPGDIFDISILDHFYQNYQTFPQADLFYFDCEYPADNTTQVLPFFKPSAISPQLLLSVNYLSRSFIKTSTALQQAGKGNMNLRFNNLELDLILRLVENNATSQHIPKVLIRQASLSETDDKQTDFVITSHLKRTGQNEPSILRGKSRTRILWKGIEASVSIIIPSKNNFRLLSNLVKSILSVTDYSNYSITIVDNASDNPELLNYYSVLKRNPILSIIQYDKPFNYSEAINLGVEKTDSDLVLFLNNDMKVIDPWWLQELAQWAMQPEIGVVGGKLLRANHTIQHYGVILGMNGFMGHLYLNAPEHYSGLLGSADWYRNFYAVTGACQMVRREIFNQVGKYNEKYCLVFGDIDFCLRVHDQGFRNMVTPFARLIHLEGKSRGYKSPIEDILFGFEQMTKRLENDDPYFSPNLTYSPIPICQLSGSSINTRLENIESRRNFLEKSKGQNK